jgi:hypothetical protein
MSVLEIWGAEYQENDALLIKPDDLGLLEAVCARERCLMSVSVVWVEVGGGVGCTACWAGLWMDGVSMQVYLSELLPQALQLPDGWIGCNMSAAGLASAMMPTINTC